MNRVGVFRLNARGCKPAPRRRQRGVTLIELMVSIVIGLLTIAVALGALLVSRGMSGTVSDAAQLQQRAAYALRIIGQQVRQAGSMQLKLGANLEDPVAFMTTGYTAIKDVVSGTDEPPTLAVSFPEKNVDSLPAVFKSCLGSEAKNNKNGLITSTFSLKDGQLKCSDGGNNGAQPLIQNVAGFQVRYLVQPPGQTSAPTMYYATAADVKGNWNQVYAVEVCLDLFGDEPVDLGDLTYTDCTGAPAPFDKRLHMVFRNTFQIRSQGLF